MRILVLGAGAIGGYFGARLTQAGRDVTFLVLPESRTQLRRNGLWVVSPHGDLKLEPKLIVASDISGPYDLVILAIKAYGLDQAINDLRPAIGGATIILPLLNGMRHVELLAAAFGDNAVLGGLCMVAMTVDRDHRIFQLDDEQEMSYGERDGGRTPRILALDKLMQDAGFEARLSDTILQDMWQKWVMQATASGLNCLLRGNIGEIQAVADGARLASRFLDESAAIAAACGHELDEKFLTNTRKRLTENGSQFSTSMYRDLEAKAPLEVDHILGDLLHRGCKHGLNTPLLEATVVQLTMYQNRHQGETNTSYKGDGRSTDG